MNDNDVLKYLLNLGLETLINRSGQEVADFISGSNIPPRVEQVPEDAPTGTSFDDERQIRLNQKEEDLTDK